MPETPPTLLEAIALSSTASWSFPFSIPTIASVERVEFGHAVTFFAGGNGTGKSTLLEAIAIRTDRVPVSADGYESIHPGVHALAESIQLEWRTGMEKGRTLHRSRGFFLRAEDFLEYKRGLVEQMSSLRREAASFEGRLEGYGLLLARGATAGQADALAERYGEDPDAMSHGESFLHFFRARFTGPGLYLLDEPDTALSPQSVLGLMAALGEMVRGGAQFIIATHNPILLGYPNAAIFGFDDPPIRPVAWEDLEQVRLVRDFIGHPAAYLRHLDL